MSFNFFKTTPQKTDATLKFSSVLDHLNEKNGITSNSSPLNIDQFIQQENIHLGQHQGFYKESANKNTEALKSISKDDTQYDTRLLVNSLIELSKTMPEIKSQALDCSDKLQIALVQNDHTINDIHSINQSL